MHPTTFSHFPIQPLAWTLPCPTIHHKMRSSRVYASASQSPRQATHSLPPEKLEIFKYLEPWASQCVLPLLNPVEKCWQPNDFLPNPCKPSDEFFEEVRDLRQRVMELPDDYFVMLAGNMITEDALPTYQTVINTWDGTRDMSGYSPSPWATWTRAWTAEENRHGDLLRTYLYLSGRVNMQMIEKTIQYLIGAGMDNKTENNPYAGYVYVSFQERATHTAHGNMARLAKEGADPMLARICGTIAADEKRHEHAYSKIVDKLLDVDPNITMIAIANMMKKKITMPMHFMYDGQDPNLFEHFSAMSQKTGVYTTRHYAEILEHFIVRWNLEKFQGLTSGEARRAQDFVCQLPPKVWKLISRANERAKTLDQSQVKFSWIFNN